jgi:hypothetical protein
LVQCFSVPEGGCMPVSDIQASMSYSSASLFAGLPLDLVPQVETVLDNQPSCVLVVAQGPVGCQDLARGRGRAGLGAHHRDRRPGTAEGSW